VKILSRNIRQGGGTRAARIMDSIISHDPDVIALSEFRTKPGAPLCAKLAEKGWPYIESTNPTAQDNGLCVMSRTPIVRARPCPAPPENRVR
jgi:exodeoxyribonuclease III